MKKKHLNLLIGLLREKEVLFSEGLSDSEVLEVEKKYDFMFPPDYKAFLQTALPISGGFPNWRESLSSEKAEKEIRRSLAWPLVGMLFDIENNVFWRIAWGKKPATKEAREAVVLSYYETFPKLIKVCGHRYIPASPHENDNPIFSVYQMDIIHYGKNLADYFAHEFRFELPADFDVPAEAKEIGFWTECVEGWGFGEEEDDFG